MPDFVGNQAVSSAFVFSSCDAHEWLSAFPQRVCRTSPSGYEHRDAKYIILYVLIARRWVRLPRHDNSKSTRKKETGSVSEWKAAAEAMKAR